MQNLLQIHLFVVFDQSARSKNSSILFTYMAEAHGDNTEGKLLFWFGLQASGGGSKRVFFFSFAWVGHLERT
jgi:hypothetical protein